MKPLFTLTETAPATAPTGQSFALSRSRHLPTQRLGKHMIRPENATEILANLPQPGHVLHTVVKGDFILTDLITQIARQSGQCPRLTLGTLSMNPENARELAKLRDEELIGGITLVLSDFFFRTSRDAVEECFQILPAPSTRWIKCRSHVKIALIPTADDAYVLHGSANLRSSANLENLTIENDRQLLEWHASWVSELNTL